MEQPYKGRAILQDNFTDLQIIIPAKRHWFITIFLSFWLCGWLLGEIFALKGVVGLLVGTPVTLFLLVWLIFWSIGGFFAFQTLLWSLIGKEILTIGQGVLTVRKRGALIFKSKTYDLNEVKNIRVQDDNSFKRFTKNHRNDYSPFSAGIIRFDYGMKTIKVAGGIDEVEANFIINKLKERRLLTDKNYS